MSENQLSAGVLSKNKLFEDVFDGKVPERVPRLVFGDNVFENAASLQNAGGH